MSAVSYDKKSVLNIFCKVAKGWWRGGVPNLHHLVGGHQRHSLPRVLFITGPALTSALPECGLSLSGSPKASEGLQSFCIGQSFNVFYEWFDNKCLKLLIRDQFAAAVFERRTKAAILLLCDICAFLMLGCLVLGLNFLEIFFLH